MPDPAFRSLFTDTENVRWETMNQVSVRARRRTIGQAATVAAVVTAGLVSGGVAVAQVGREPVPPPVATAPPSPATSPPSTGVAPTTTPATTPTTTPATEPVTTPPSAPDPPRTSSKSTPVTGITSAMMLRPGDVGSGYAVVAGGGGDWTFEFNASLFGCPRGAKPEPSSERGRQLRKGQPQDEDFVVQATGRYAGDQAADYLDEVAERVSSCAPGAGRSVRVADRNFAGDESLLVIFDHGGGYLAKLVLVRKGDVLTEIFSKPARSDAASRELGRRAAARF